jgi:hypothetical protein
MNFVSEYPSATTYFLYRSREYMHYTIVEVMICMHLWLYLLEKKRNLSM